jgi:hypothetical protein
MARFAVPTLLILIFIAYFSFQVCPTFYFWDSAELTAAVIADGVPHPPGFPLLLMLGKLFIAVTPFEDSRALNLMSALFAAIGLGLWFLVIRNVLKSYYAESRDLALGLYSLLGAILLGTSFAFTIQAVRFEVYSLNFALFALMLLITLNICKAEGGLNGRVLLLAVVIGLALGAHILTIVLAVPGIILLLFLSRRSRMKLFPVAVLVSLVAGIAVYGYIYFLASRQPIQNWGDPSDFQRFLDYLTAREFTTSVSSFGLGHIMANIAFVLNLMIRQFGLPAVLLSVWGLYDLVRYRRKIGYPLFLILVLNMISIVFSEDFYYENYDQHGYLLISLAVMALSAVIGLWLLYGLLSRLMQRREIQGPGRRALTLTVLTAFLACAYPLSVNTFSADLSDVRGAEEYADQFLSAAPERAVIVTSFYNTYFCLLAKEAVVGISDSSCIVNIYNWDHRWGREDAGRRYEGKLNFDADRQAFYRGFLNALMGNVQIYVEYDESSAPLAKYLLPDGPGYLLTAPDTSVVFDERVTGEIEPRLAALADEDDLETVKTWLLWFQNRALFYERRGYPDVAKDYFSAAESLTVGRSN